ncbi:oxidoreductase [Shimia sp.]|uniref:oxidoreductase n=1 Tax=Shimia sp. TaxID=1954381 RepID=UPI003B8E3477
MTTTLFTPLTLPCGTTLKNRIAKAAMSDSLGDGTGHPTVAQTKLYGEWAKGGLALSIIGEVQPTPDFAEKPGNLVLDAHAERDRFRPLAQAGAANNSQLWLQLGHAGAMAYAPISQPQGPSALNIAGLTCTEMSLADIHALPTTFAQTAQRAQTIGFGGVELHAAHGFLLSQFLSPLFNKRTDAYGGSIQNRMRLLLECLEAIREAVGAGFPIGLKLNATDQLDGGLTNEEALEVVRALDHTSLDLIDISGGTYFPGARAASDSAGSGPYFEGFAKRARQLTRKPLMLTGGIKTRAQAAALIESGVVDLVGLARALVLAPDLPDQWARVQPTDPDFPRFQTAPEGGITAWYTMQMTALGNGRPTETATDLATVLKAYNQRDAVRADIWRAHFGIV